MPKSILFKQEMLYANSRGWESLNGKRFRQMIDLVHDEQHRQAGDRAKTNSNIYYDSTA